MQTSYISNEIRNTAIPNEQNILDGILGTEVASNLEGDGILIPERLWMKIPEESVRAKPYVKILEEPASKSLRFRYECEGRSTGSIPGVNSTPKKKTFPAIKVEGFQGNAVVVVSCVTKDYPYRAHPYNLIGKVGCDLGVCTFRISADTMTAEFTSLGIQCTKKKDMGKWLHMRKKIGIDPFRTGFNHINHPTAIDWNAIRLCFQVFIEGDIPGQCTIPLEPVVSQPIFDKKGNSDLAIVQLSNNTCSVCGSKKDFIILCNKAVRGDIRMLFYEETSDWSVCVEVDQSQIYRTCAISFKPPEYKTLDILEPVEVFLQLWRPSDDSRSEPLLFEYKPDDKELVEIILSENENSNMAELEGEYFTPQPVPQWNIPVNGCSDFQEAISMQPPYVRIVEQPAHKAIRFRYECEGKSVGSIPGINSTQEKKTYPSIEIIGYKGKAFVIVSCVTKDWPYRPHPHNVVGKKGCKEGVCSMEISVDTTITIPFSNLGIRCMKKKDIENSLRRREELRIDPFRTGFNHKHYPNFIDMNAIRLCFQVFLQDTRGKYTIPLKPVVSEPVYDKRVMSDLKINKLSDCISSMEGGKLIILLCEKVVKEDIQVRFYDPYSKWEGFAELHPSQVHKQYAIWFMTPRYKFVHLPRPVQVFIQLRRPSDGVTSESLPFEMWPSHLLDSNRRWAIRKNITGEDELEHNPKRQKLENLRSMQESDTHQYSGPLNPYQSNHNMPLNITEQPQAKNLLDSPSPLNPEKDPMNLDSDEIKMLASNVDPQCPLPELQLSSRISDDDDMKDSLTKLTNLSLNQFD
ncbi:uncharacterized protein isoform X2 [Leptinotarsa decemlineata]|uniref:uncharacterized protein isoform X2 n=1 Tax=Leptinotarsa decemlineata TaxID=7539 RepID=UPI003D30CF7F